MSYICYLTMRKICNLNFISLLTVVHFFPQIRR